MNHFIGDLQIPNIDFSETVCVGRTADQFAQDGTGEGLWIQTGLNPITNHMNIPLQQSHVDETRWTQGKCFYLMGG